MNMHRQKFNVLVAVLACCLLPCVNGCGGNNRQQELDQIEQAVRRGLQCWQEGKPAESLQDGDGPLEFFDEDWKRGAKLLEFEILKTYLDSGDEPRCFVRLKIQAAGQPASEVECNYKIRVQPSVMVARDPMG